MVLSNQKIAELVKNPKSKTWIQKAKYHQDRLKFHSNEVLSFEEFIDNPYAKEWLKNIETNLVQRKYETFKSLIEYPLPTTSLVDSIKDQYAKVFEAKDAFFDIHIQKEKKVGLKEFLTKTREEVFWKEKALDLLFSDVNSLLMVDLPPVEVGGDPFFYTVDIESVHEVSETNGKLDYIVISLRDEDEGKYYKVVDDENYYEVFHKGEDVVITKTAYHGIGQVPCNFIFQEGLTNKNPYIKRSGISSVLGSLDTLVRKYTAKENLDLYNAFPIYWKYQEDDDDEFDKQTIIDEYVDAGKTTSEALTLYDDYIRKKKIKNPLLGAGTVIEVPTPSDNTEPDLRDPVGIISPDKTSLEYNTTEVERLEDKIFRKATGRPQEKEIADRPVASQIQSQYEGERNVLLWVSEQMSKSRKWLVEVLCKAKGEDVVCTASFGSEFFIEDERSVLENFKLYKEAGASQSALSMRNKSLIEASTKGKPTERERLYLLEHLEPMPLMDLEKVREYVELDLVEFKEWDLKLNFAERVNKFERENGNILAYEPTLTVKEKINKIKSILYSYGKSKRFDNGEGTKQPISNTQGGGQKGALRN